MKFGSKLSLTHNNIFCTYLVAMKIKIMFSIPTRIISENFK